MRSVAGSDGAPGGPDAGAIAPKPSLCARRPGKTGAARRRDSRWPVASEVALPCFSQRHRDVRGAGQCQICHRQSCGRTLKGLVQCPASGHRQAIAARCLRSCGPRPSVSRQRRPCPPPRAGEAPLGTVARRRRRRLKRAASFGGRLAHAKIQKRKGRDVPTSLMYFTASMPVVAARSGGRYCCAATSVSAVTVDRPRSAQGVRNSRSLFGALSAQPAFPYRSEQAKHAPSGRRPSLPLRGAGRVCDQVPKASCRRHMFFAG